MKTEDDDVTLFIGLKNPGNNLQKKRQQQQQEAPDKKTAHIGSALAFFCKKREKERNKPQQQSKFKDHQGGLYS